MKIKKLMAIISAIMLLFTFAPAGGSGHAVQPNCDLPPVHVNQ